MGSAPLGVGLAGEPGRSLQPVAPLAARLTLRPVGGAAAAAPQEAVLGPGEGRAGADCRSHTKTHTKKNQESQTGGGYRSIGPYEFFFFTKVCVCLFGVTLWSGRGCVVLFLIISHSPAPLSGLTFLGGLPALWQRLDPSVTQMGADTCRHTQKIQTPKAAAVNLRHTPWSARRRGNSVSHGVGVSSASTAIFPINLLLCSTCPHLKGCFLANFPLFFFFYRLSDPSRRGRTPHPGSGSPPGSCGRSATDRHAPDLLLSKCLRKSADIRREAAVSERSDKLGIMEGTSEEKPLQSIRQSYGITRIRNR